MTNHRGCTQQKFTISIILLIVYVNIAPINAQCKYDIEGDPESKQPIYIKPGKAEFFKPIYESGKFYIQLNEGEKIEFWCTGPWDAPFAVATDYTTLTCKNRKLSYTIKNKPYYTDLKSIKCRNFPETTAILRTGTNAKCADDGNFIDVGYQVDGRFPILYTVCHDKVQKANKYVHNHIPKYVNARQRGVALPQDWKMTSHYYGFNMHSLYSIFKQRERISYILNIDSESNLYVHKNAKASSGIEPTEQDKFLSRGHLAPVADFIFASWQYATYDYLNAAPQWQGFNGFNWEGVERWARNQAKNYDNGLEVYTGTHGIMVLPNIRTSMKEIFLKTYPSNTVPVPKFYYKILINRSKKEGVAFIGVNNPFVKIDLSNKRQFVICNDKSDDLQYTPSDQLEMKRKSQIRGYIYACEVKEFLSVVKLTRYIELGSNIYSLLGRKAVVNG